MKRPHPLPSSPASPNLHAGPDLPSRRHTLQKLLGWPLVPTLAVWAGPAQAAVGGLVSAAHGDTSDEWERIRRAVFGEARLITGAGVVQLQAPLRAAYGAAVPVKVISSGSTAQGARVVRHTLFVDKNPSPQALRLDLGPALANGQFETRLRVDEYSHVRVVTELSNGDLHTDSRFVKTSGGCSAPPNRDAPERIGQMQWQVPTTAPATGNDLAVEWSLLHPNDTGFELDQVTLRYIPPYYLRTVRMQLDGQAVFDAEMDFSVSENPQLRFHVKPSKPGQFKAEARDSKDRQFVSAYTLGAA